MGGTKNKGAHTGFPEGGEDIPSTHTPLGHFPCDVIHIPIGFQYQDKFERGYGRGAGTIFFLWGGGGAKVLICLVIAKSDAMLTKVPPAGCWHVLLTPPGGPF